MDERGGGRGGRDDGVCICVCVCVRALERAFMRACVCVCVCVCVFASACLSVSVLIANRDRIIYTHSNNAEPTHLYQTIVPGPEQLFLLPSHRRRPL